MRCYTYLRLVLLLMLTSTSIGWASSAGCPDFYLRDESGAIINPVSGENTAVPFSMKQTCGHCHDYETITGGYHFQQGWEVIRDDFAEERNQPWVLSDGMLGKW